MGKYTKKAKMTVDVALTDLSKSYLGVRTRAKTLALQRLQSIAAALPPSHADASYLELRSRRLEKPMQLKNSPNNRRDCVCAGEEIRRHEEECSFAEGVALGIEASFGENDLEFEDRERGTLESTPSSSARATDTITTPGSTSKQTCSNASSERAQNALVINAPCARELEEFFAREEQSIQRRFIEKYNYDIVKDIPLSGRYDWVAVTLGTE